MKNNLILQSTLTGNGYHVINGEQKEYFEKYSDAKRACQDLIDDECADGVEDRVFPDQSV